MNTERTNLIIKESGLVGILLALAYLFGFWRLQTPFYNTFGIIPYSASDYLIAGVPSVVLGGLLFLAAGVIYSVSRFNIRGKSEESKKGKLHSLDIDSTFPVCIGIIKIFLAGKCRVVVIFSLFILIFILTYLQLSFVIYSIGIFMFLLMLLDFWFQFRLNYGEYLKEVKDNDFELIRMHESKVSKLEADISLLADEIEHLQGTEGFDLAVYAKQKDLLGRIIKIKESSKDTYKIQNTLNWFIVYLLPFAHYILGLILIVFTIAYGLIAVHAYDKVFPVNYPKVKIVNKGGMTTENVRIVTINNDLVYMVDDNLEDNCRLMQLSEIDSIEYLHRNSEFLEQAEHVILNSVEMIKSVKK